ncbi:aldo/keto reductase [Helicobacter sp. MIT 11-5569]|uniref:aldo/keto reductase n=1 Tax=Helicobacter sp. MIT 11-5569 TaxID=1548151 RepID=UPI00051FCBAC|nr:aldo/keto reductase [Helicobacter sp. MIT 11-5569]TLD79873.1 aldo/keto reductase [Helicobacter sp. MIT 11-5569]
MIYRRLGNSGLKIPVMTLGTATFGGVGDIFKAWGNTQLQEAKELISVCLENGANAFDTADCYSNGKAEEILGALIKDRRKEIFLSTKTGMSLGDGENDSGTSFARIMQSCEESLKRLQTDYIDLYYFHCFDALTPIEEMLRAIEILIKQGKIRYFGVSNYSAWHLMKMLSICEKYNLPKPVAHQAYYSLAARELEWELLPLGIDQKVGTLVWSPLSGSLLSGKISRTKTPPNDSRLSTNAAWSVDKEKLFDIIDVCEEISKQTGYSVAQISLAWLLTRPSVSGLIIGAKTKEQLVENFKATQITLSCEHLEKLDKVSRVRPVYPYWHQQWTVSHRDPHCLDITTDLTRI